MTPEAQRIAIAKACGWTRMSQGHLPQSGRQHPLLGDYDLCGTPPEDRDKEEDDQSFKQVPDYFNDLNAMHEVEAGRYWGETDVYQHHLENITFAVGIRVWHATAAHRAEAFLKSINKWEAEK